MPISVSKIVDQVNGKIIQANQNTIDTARLAGAAFSFDDVGFYSVVNEAALPLAADNTGRMIYVQSLDAYRYSDGTQWSDYYDSEKTIVNSQLLLWGSSFSTSPLGDGSLTLRCSPTREFCSSTNWCNVSTGIGQRAAVKLDGTLWVWGGNLNGAIGDGTTTSKCSPVREFTSSTNWTFVSGKACHKTALKSDGSLWTWGLNTAGQLGRGNYVATCSPVREFTSSNDWIFVDGGTANTVGIKLNGSLWSWGSGNCGALGNGLTTLSCLPVREFCSDVNWCRGESGTCFSSGLKTNGQIWSWGLNNEGQLGIGTTVSQCSPVREISSSTNWCSIAVSLTSGQGAGVGAIKIDGTLWSWGSGINGMLGDGTTVNKCSPVREISSSTNWCTLSQSPTSKIAIKTDGSMWGWGSNYAGKLGDGTTISRCSPVREISSSTNWSFVSSGNIATSAIRVNLSKGFDEI